MSEPDHAGDPRIIAWVEQDRHFGADEYLVLRFIELDPDGQPYAVATFDVRMPVARRLAEVVNNFDRYTRSSGRSPG